MSIFLKTELTPKEMNNGVYFKRDDLYTTLSENKTQK
jgi:hypothetical protein